MLKFLNKLSSQASWFIILTAGLCLLIVGFLDYAIVANISLGIFYLFPIFLVTWFSGEYIGFIFSFLSSIAWLVAELHAQKSGNILIVEWNALVRLIVFLLITYLLAKIRQLQKREENLARTDALTGIWNRFYFLELLDWQVKRFQRNCRPFTLAYIDIDNFKTVNDTWGHSRGDRLLVLIAQVLTQNIREIDFTARLGGDEFVLVLPETDRKTGNIVLKRIQQRLFEAINLESLPIGFSIGAITFYRLPKSINEIVEKADRLMYEVKREGKNQLKHQAYR